MIHLAYFSYVYICCYVMQINYCYYYRWILKNWLLFQPTIARRRGRMQFYLELEFNATRFQQQAVLMLLGQ